MRAHNSKGDFVLQNRSETFVWKISGIKKKSNLDLVWRIQLKRLKFPTHTTRIINLIWLLIVFAKPNLSQKYIYILFRSCFYLQSEVLQWSECCNWDLTWKYCILQRKLNYYHCKSERVNYFNRIKGGCKDIHCSAQIPRYLLIIKYCIL